MTTQTDIRQELLQEINKLSAPQLTEVLEFIHNINITESKNGDQAIQKQEKKRQAGALQGKIWMSDDFDEPLEEMQEYM